MRRIHSWLFIIFISLPLLGGCSSKEARETKNSAKPSTPIVEERLVEIVEVIPKPISYTLSAVGSLKTPENVTISPKKSGIIEKILVKEGDRVKKGQVLIQLDDAEAKLQLERTEARVREAEASLENDQTKLSRYQKLLESKVVPQQVFDDISLKVKLDQAQLALAKVDLNLGKQNLSDHRIASPIEGIVNLKIASLGEHVNVAPKDEILKIVQMDPLELEFSVPENWIGKIQLGTKILFTLKAFSEEKFSATLQFISPTADPTTRNIKMKALVRNPNYRLKPGFFVEVMLQTGSHPNAIIIPESAFFSQEGKFYAFVIQNGVAYRREVETGQRFEGTVEVLKGVQKGEWVVTVGHEQLNDGAKVKVKQ